MDINREINRKKKLECLLLELKSMDGVGVIHSTFEASNTTVRASILDNIESLILEKKNIIDSYNDKLSNFTNKIK